MSDLMPNIYGYGQVFAFSALDGESKYKNDFAGTLTAKPVGIRFELTTPRTLSCDCSISKAVAVSGDVINIAASEGDILIVYRDRHCVIGYSPVLPTLKGGACFRIRRDTYVSLSIKDIVILVVEESPKGYKFSLCYGGSLKNTLKRARAALNNDAAAIKAERETYYQKLPRLINAPEDYSRLLAKAASVMKANVYSPEGIFPCRWTTPDRVPHRNLWLWDSVFHAIGWSYIDPRLAEEAILALMATQTENGFIPHMASNRSISKITQPPIIAWGILELYNRSKNVNFVKACAAPVANFLKWVMASRDINKNGLPEWRVTSDKNCRSDECGMDNSPRFDSAQIMDAIDFSSFYANDSRCLSKLFGILGDKTNADYWQSQYTEISAKINELLWSEEDGNYYDRQFDGKLNKAATVSSFLPLFAGVATTEQAAKLHSIITDSARFWTEFPLPSIAINNPSYNGDMWRGGVWINYNYMIAKGLREYGYDETADKLVDKTLSYLSDWYKKTGGLSEFYDAHGVVESAYMPRKGVIQALPDWRNHMHAIIDFGWTCALTIAMLYDKFSGKT